MLIAEAVNKLRRYYSPNLTVNIKPFCNKDKEMVTNRLLKIKKKCILK
ncbi:hypothetical protein PPBDW_II1260 [Photobacterium kishitanii]|nr:hypothetical protein PPBDW_II1260 [Photobacterium kishitanii]